MTNEKARELLADIKGSIIITAHRPYVEALELAIKALEQQPCEDCISREEAIKIVFPYVDGDLIADAIKHLPSVTPKGVTITDFADRCRECGKQKVGKWIGELWGYSCSQCKGCIDEDVKHLKYRYCPKCGAKMEAENEKETC